MSSLNRRGVLGRLLSLPFLAWVTPLRLFASDVATATRAGGPGRANDRKLVATKTLRLINTTQRRFFDVHGRYADMQELYASKVLREFLDSEKAQKKGMGWSFYSTLRFGQSEIAPGWKFRFKLRDAGRAYTVGLNDISSDGLGAFSSDENAVIYEGASWQAADWETTWRDAGSVLEAGHPIGSRQHRHRGFGAFLKTAAFAFLLIPQDTIEPVQGPGCCTCDMPGGCCCNCAGCEDTSRGGCVNCGCASCVWCCA